ncbi:MAG: hypothetical protein K2G45_03775 [Lachnospiraceae bacterium]|nr:hypothetical protein [Lachnospiraceae bacterium]
MKIDKIVEYCDRNIKRYASKRVCRDCNHCTKCPRNCGKCLDQVHLSRDVGERQDYDCQYMVQYYVCRYMYAYATEIEDGLSVIENEIMKLQHIHMLSIGSGPSPDLYALWKFKKDNNYSKPISYIGFEHNEYWEDINEKTTDIFSESNIRIQYFYEDAIETFKTKNLAKTNILVLQYVLSHVVYNGREDEIEEFFNDLIENVILSMEDRAFIIINDINHYLARDRFELLEKMIENRRKNIQVHKYYYPYNGIKDGQRDGMAHESCDLDWDYEIDNEFVDYYSVRTMCRSAQHIIEVF